MKNKQSGELAVCGFEAVKALADKHGEKIERLFFNQDKARFFSETCKSLASRRKIYRLVEDSELEKLCKSVHHQGVVAMIANPEIPALDRQTVSSWEVSCERVLVLDRVGNANNLGAIVRSAAFFGISSLVISREDDQAELSTSSWRVAQGGMEYVNIYSAGSAAALLEDTAGRFVRIGADHRSSVDISAFSRLASANKGVLVVLGNEESGLSPRVKAACDHLVKIPGSGSIESLNVAQAATLFLYEMVRP